MNVLRSLEEFDLRRRRGMYVACMYVCMYVCIYACVYVCMCVCMVCTYVRAYYVVRPDGSGSPSWGAAVSQPQTTAAR